MIHPTAIIHPKARLADDVQVGPFSVIEEHVVVGRGCRIGPHVHLTGHTVIGEGNSFHAGAVIGDAPQDLKYGGEPTRLRIGSGNIFREHATVHRSSKLAEETVIGSNNLLMAHSHVGHNVVMGNNIILANGALLAGHVTVDDRVFISGNCMAHQFVRIGELAMMQGGAAVSKDLPPYTIARGDNHICGLNIVGLRRVGFKAEQRLELKKVYRALFRSGRSLRQAAEAAAREFGSEPAQVLIDFVTTSKRGVCTDNSAPGDESADE